MRRLCLVALILLCGDSARASLANVYIAQNATGAANGADCADALAVTFFNTAGNWGSGGSQIGAGTTIHLCGTFTGTSNSTMLTIQGSGSTGSPVTILFEGGAQLNAPYWTEFGGAIGCTNKNWITIDGGTNGIIQNTANGTGLANSQASSGVFFSGCNNSEVRNLSIQNIYVHTATPSDQGGSHNTFGILYYDHCDMMSVHNNTITNTFGGIYVGYNTLTNATFYNNTIDFITWGIVVGDNGGTSTATGVIAHNNAIGGHFFVWKDNAFANHFDGIFYYAANAGASFNGGSIYNNYIHGDMDVAGTGYIFLYGGAGTLSVPGISNIDVYNNLLIQDATQAAPGPEALLEVSGGDNQQSFPQNIRMFNNTLVGAQQNGNDNGIVIRSTASGLVIENNIIAKLTIGVLLWANSFTYVGTSNFNDFFSLTHFACDNRFTGPQNCKDTLADWQTQSFDANSSTSDPKLDATFHLVAGSAAIALGPNLTSLGITMLDRDKEGIPRPPTGAWAAGAYQGSAANTPQPPAGLRVVVN